MPSFQITIVALHVSPVSPSSGTERTGSAGKTQPAYTRETDSPLIGALVQQLGRALHSHPGRV